MTVPGATANSTATNSGSRIVSRRSFKASSNAIATDAPIQALRPSVSAAPSEQQIDQVLAVFAEIGVAMGLIEAPLKRVSA